MTRANARFRAFADAMPHVVFTANAEGVVQFANAEFARLTGARPGSELGRGYLDYVHPDDLARFGTLRAAGLHATGPVTMEYRLRTVDGYRWRLMRLVPVRNRAGILTGWYGTATDIDDVKRDSARLRAQAAILDQLTEGIVVRDLEHRVLYWNRGAEQLYGWRSDEVLGRAVTDFLHRQGPEWVEAVDAVLATGDWQGTLVAHAKDGARVVIEAHWTLVRDEAGTAVSITGIHLDISGRLALEQREQRAMRLDAVGELSGGLAHDFNNLLTVILGNSELLVGRLDADPRLRALAEMTRGAAQRGAVLTQRLLAFARRQMLDPQTVDLGQLLHGLRPILESTLREDIALVIATEAARCDADVDATQLENAVVSLCANARDALPRGGTVHITVTNLDLSVPDAAGAAELSPGHYLRIDVEDDGIGMAPEVVEHAFDPFFTTKQRSKGTGLGLSMVYGFAKQSRGHASVVSEPGRGTTVSLLLPQPRASDVAFTVGQAGTHGGQFPSTKAGPDAATRASEPGGETILVTEDDELVRTFVCEQLATFGYRVECARDAHEAMRILERGTPIDLLFTDMVMPGGMNGRELAAAARAVRPGLPVLFTSGYADDVVGNDERLETGMRLLGKPYTRATLARMLRAALASSDRSVTGVP